MNIIKEKWNKIPKWLKISFVILLVIIIIFSCCSEEDENSGNEKTIVEVCAEKYSLQKDWCETMNEYIPNFELVYNIEPEGLSAYKVSLSDGSEYYVSITLGDNDEEREVVKIQTTERDYYSRTVLYDKFAD